MGVLHHVENPVPMVNEIYRVLKPGGTFILMLYNRFSWKACVILPVKRLIYPKFWGRSFQEVLNANDGDGCPLAKVYSRREGAELLKDFSGLEFELNQLSWKQLFLVPGLGKLLKPVLPSCSESLPARVMGWNLYITACRPGG
jgi:SAM-dependent methyltransferase